VVPLPHRSIARGGASAGQVLVSHACSAAKKGRNVASGQGTNTETTMKEVGCTIPYRTLAGVTEACENAKESICKKGSS